MGRASSTFVASIARRALLVAAACLLTVGVAPALADGPLGLDAKVDAGGTVSGVTAAVAGAVPPSVGAPAAPATTSAPALAKRAADVAAAPAASHRVQRLASKPPAEAPAAGAQQALDRAAPTVEQAAPTVQQVTQHVDRVAPAAAPVVHEVDRVARQVTPLLHQVTPLLQPLDPLVGHLTTLLPPIAAPLAGLVESRGWRLPGLGTAERPAANGGANGDALSGTRAAQPVGALPPSRPRAGLGPRGEEPSSAPAGSTTLAPREALRPPLSRSVPGGAPAGGGSSGFFFSPFLALLVLVALAAPTLLRRSEPPPAFLRPALLACALERPG
jgi:hypothetical protein